MNDPRAQVSREIRFANKTDILIMLLQVKEHRHSENSLDKKVPPLSQCHQYRTPRLRSLRKLYCTQVHLYTVVCISLLLLVFSNVAHYRALLRAFLKGFTVVGLALVSCRCIEVEGRTFYSTHYAQWCRILHRKLNRSLLVQKTEKYQRFDISKGRTVFCCFLVCQQPRDIILRDIQSVNEMLSFDGVLRRYQLQLSSSIGLI